MNMDLIFFVLIKIFHFIKVEKLYNTSESRFEDK